MNRKKSALYNALRLAYAKTLWLEGMPVIKIAKRVHKGGTDMYNYVIPKFTFNRFDLKKAEDCLQVVIDKYNGLKKLNTRRANKLNKKAEVLFERIALIRERIKA